MVQATEINYPYGAFELKRVYQKNVFIGNMSVVTLIGLIMFSVWLYSIITHEEIVDPGGEPPPIVIHVIPGPPPSIEDKRPQVEIAKPQTAVAQVGIPTPVPDDEVVDEDIVMASRQELQDINTPVFSADGDGRGRIIIEFPLDDKIPPPDAFQPVEKQPVQTYEEPPEYPRLAQEGGFTAFVIVEAYVDRNGKVKKAQAVKCSRENMGFEEAAVRAAYKNEYRPAIQNGEPVGVWISYRVDFVLPGH